MKKIIYAVLINLILLVPVFNPVMADGIIIPEPPFPPELPGRPLEQLVIEYHHVDVTIENQIAVTHVDQTFHNPNDWPVEGTYIFPVPLDAVVTDFILWIDGEPVKAEVLDAEEARQTYEQIVRELKDPALLEYVGQNAVKASVFPIEPGESRRIELEYQQALSADSGLVRYVYPLNTEKFSAQPLESVKISVDIKSSQPIRAVYSPTHSVDLSRESPNNTRVGYEDENITPDSDFALYYSIGESEALHLLSYRDPADQEDNDGFFMLMLAPSPEENEEVIAKDVLLILDRSGSMEGEKFRQAQSALEYILQHLNEEDRFFLTAFSTGIETYASKLVSAEEAESAIDWVSRQGAAGSTDINRALLETISVADSERPTYVIFLTDGLPTEGVTDSAMILENLVKEAGSNIRLFPFGVGYDVDTFLLDSLSRAHHGLSTYVQPGEPLDEILSTFYSRINTPVLTDLSLDFDGVSVYDLYPQPLPDLFSGSQIIITGRYREGGSADITLKGVVNDDQQEFNYEDIAFASSNASDSSLLASLPRLWATRKIGYLMNQIRLEGPDQEMIDQIVALSIRYGIITPYTSYLVTEPMPLGASNQAELARDAYEEALAAPAEVMGQQAVEKADQEGALYQADIAPSNAGDYSTVKTIWSRTFVFRDGIWLDSVYDPDQMEPVPVRFLSDEYFELASLRKDIGAALALGDHIIIVIDGTAYEITPEGDTDPDFDLPLTNQDQTQVPGQESSTNSGDNFIETSSGGQNPNKPEQTKTPSFPRTAFFITLIGLATCGFLFLAFLFIRSSLNQK